MTSKNTDSFKIRVTNRQSAGDMSDTITEGGRGTYRLKDGIGYISYAAGNTKVFIKAGKNGVSVKRTGETKSDMRYEQGKSIDLDYVTPYGTFDMKLYTETVIIRLDEKGGKISLRYTLETGGDKLYNNMIIHISKD